MLTLSVLEGSYVICRLESNAPVPDWAWHGELANISKTRDELSIVCSASNVPDSVSDTISDTMRCEREWAALKLHGPFDFALTGVLVSVLEPLRDAGIGIFAVSTFDTDYVLVKNTNLKLAIQTLRKAGHDIRQ